MKSYTFGFFSTCVIKALKARISMEYVHQSNQGNLYYSFEEGVILHWVNISMFLAMILI